MIKRRLGFAGILLAGLILVLYLTGGGKIFGRLGVSRCEKLWKESEEVMVEGEVYQKTRKEEKLILYLKKIQIREMGNGKAVADERLLVYLDEKGNGPEIGQRILVKGNVGFFDPAANPGNFDQKNYYKQQNIQAVLWKGKVLEKQVKKTSFREKLWQFRNRTADEICREMGKRRGGILCAVLLGDSFYTEEDVKKCSPKFWVWRDNALWKIHELTLYFEKIGPMLKENNPELLLCPDMSQWGYFLNIYGRTQQDIDNEFSDLWDTAMRGIDIYALAPYVDSCHFITVPVTPDGYPDSYVVSCQHSMMRVMNQGKPFIGGIYWGRYIYNDLYALLSPSEIIGSMTACGMDGYTCYGMNGLDDGGVMNRMDTHFLDSLRMANEWFSQVICLRKGEKKKEIAILFPSEMAHLEPYEVGNNKIRRLDLLGWYKLCCDLGYQVDVISNHEIEKGTLAEYKVLIVPSNNCYFAVDHAAMEKEIRSWVCKGGVLLHGPGDLLAENCFGIQGEECEKKPYHYGKTIIAQGEAFCRYQDGKEIASYVDHGGCCVAKYEELELAQKMNTKYRPGMGAVYSFGIQIGASYAAKNIPHVPYEQGNKEMYPIIQSGTTLVKDILYHYMTPVSGICERGIETGVFENGMVVVNHRSIPYVLPEKYKIEKYQYSFHAVQNGNGILAGHEAVWVSNDTTGDDYGENKIK